MKAFERLAFDPLKAAQELGAFESLLDGQAELDERNDLLPFFHNNVHLTAFIGSLFQPARSESYAFELDLFGAFVADAAVADPQRSAYLLIEFENAKRTSVFTSRPRRATPHWSRTFETGFNQTIDWFWKLSDQRQTEAFRDVFGAHPPHIEAMLVIGRDRYLTEPDLRRLEWRSQAVVVDSRHIHVFTYDRLCRDLRLQYETLAKLNAGI